MWNWNLWCWTCFHQRRCAARKRVVFNETHFVTEFGQHIVTNVNLCSLHVNIIPSRITSGTTMPTEAQKLCTTSFQSRTAGRDSSKPWGQERVGIEYCKWLWWLYLYLLREVNRDLTAPASITSCNSVMSQRDTTCRGSDTKHYTESENHPRKRNEPARCNNTFSSQCVCVCVCVRQRKNECVQSYPCQSVCHSGIWSLLWVQFLHIVRTDLEPWSHHSFKSREDEEEEGEMRGVPPHGRSEEQRIDTPLTTDRDE